MVSKNEGENVDNFIFSIKFSLQTIILDYAESKLASIMHMQELSEQFPQVQCFSVHPGVVGTDIGLPLFRYFGFIGRILGYFLTKYIAPLFVRSPFQGAQTTLYCAISPDCEEKSMSGKYFADCKLAKVHLPYKTDTERSEMQQRLWELSQEYTNSTIEARILEANKKRSI